MDKITEVNKEPLVSILMLTYNRAEYIKEAILSVKQQTHTNWELIIIDDGSTDNTFKIIAGLADNKIRYIKHETNSGLIIRRQESLGYTHGKYVAILDSDDIWIDANKLAEQVEFMENNSAYTFVGTFIKIIDKNGSELKKPIYHTDDNNIRKNILSRNQFAHSSVLMRKSFLDKTSGYLDTKLAEDYDLFLQLGKLGKFANLPKYYTAYRIHKNSFNHKHLQMAQAVLKIVNSYKNAYPNFYRSLIKCYLRIIYYILLK